MRSCSPVLLFFSLPVSRGLATHSRCSSVSLAMTNPRGNLLHKNDASQQSRPGRALGTLSKAETSALAATTESSDHGPSSQGVLKWLSPRRLSVSIILLSAFLNLLGFTMAGPITPALGRHFGLEVGASFGSLTSAYPLGMLLGLFLWPQLSDHIGRKPVITASLIGSGLGLGAQSMVISRNGSLGLFLVTRVLTGCFAGSSPVSKAYLADVGYKDGKLPKYLALRDAASTMAYIIGPLLGGVVYELRRRLLGLSESDLLRSEVMKLAGNSLAFVIAVSAAASLAAGVLVGGFVRELPRKKNKKKTDPSSTAVDDIDDDDDFMVACPLGRQMWTGVAAVCVVSFLFNVGDSTFHAFFSALLRDRAGLDTKDIGLIYTLLACVSFSVSATISSTALKRFGPVATCAAGMSCVGSGLIALGIAASGSLATIQPFLFPFLAGSAALYYCGVPLYGPTIPTMLLRCVPSYRRGAIMGLDGAINTVARVISPLIMGEVYRRYGASTAFGAAGVAVFGGAFVALYRRLLVMKDTTTKIN